MVETAPHSAAAAIPKQRDGGARGALPLSRFTVLELSVARAGPAAGRHLADWGADVIRVEPPAAAGTEGDFAGERFGPDRLNLHRNKRSITLNLKTAEGKAVFMQMAREADVIIENMRSNVKHRLGIDYESVRAVNPRIVYGSISGFGQTGPYKDRPGVDPVVQGMGGLMSITGLPGQGPVRAGIALIDVTAGAYLAQAVLIALLERESTGVGSWVHTSLVETMISLLDFQAMRWLMGGEIAAQAGNNHPTAIPTGLFPTQDGHVLIGAGGDRMWERLCRATGLDALLADPRFSNDRARLQNRDALNDEIAAVTRRDTSQHWFNVLSEAGVPCGPVNTIDQVFADEQVKQLGMVLEGTHPRVGSLALVAQPATIGTHVKAIRRPPAELGEHTEEVLRQFGHSSDTLAALRARSVI